MAGLVKEIADTHGSRRFAHEIQGQASGAAGKHSGDRIEFPAAMREIGTGYAEISGGHASDGSEEHGVVSIPEAMLAARWHRAVNKR